MTVGKFEITHVARVFLLALVGLESMRNGFEKDEMIQDLLRDFIITLVFTFHCFSNKEILKLTFLELLLRPDC